MSGFAVATSFNVLASSDSSRRAAMDCASGGRNGADPPGSRRSVSSISRPRPCSEDNTAASIQRTASRSRTKRASMAKARGSRASPRLRAN